MQKKLISSYPAILMYFLMLFAFSMTAQPENTFYRAWVQNGGNVSPTFTQPVVTAVNSSGETYVAGTTTNASVTLSVLLTKYSSSGALVWSRTFDVNTAGNAYAGSIAIDPSGNVLVAGSAYNGATYNYDLFVVKYNSSGTKQWHQLYNGAANSYDFGAAVECSSTGDVYVTGGAFQTATNLNAVTIRYNSSGTAQWTKTWDNVSLYDAGGTISFHGSTGVTITGFSQTNASTWEYMALSYSVSTGQLVTYNVTNLGGTSIDRISDAVMDASGNLYITGALGASGQGLNIKTVKLNDALSILWTANWNGSANLDDVANSIMLDASGNVYVAGFTTNATDKDAIVIKYTSSGAASWVQTHDGGGSDAFADIALTVDGDIFAGGHTASADGSKDFFVAQYNPSGSLRWSEAYNGLPNRDDEIRAVRSDGSNNFLVTGPSEQWNGSQQVLTAKYTRFSRVLPQTDTVIAPFIENRRQVLNTAERGQDDVRYYSRSVYPNLYVFDDKVSFVFAHIDTVPASTDTMTRIDLSFKNGYATASTGLERRADFHNYYLGHIPEGRERVSLEGKVLQPGVYINTDALFGQGQDGFFLRMICKPGSNPGHIRLKFNGQTGLSILPDGSLKVETLLEDLILPAPTALLSNASGVESAPGWTPAFVINSSDTTVSFTTGTVTSGSTLILRSGRGRNGYGGGECDYYWSTYFGDTDSETALGNDVNRVNNDMYYCGKTRSAFFPVTTGTAQGDFRGVVDGFVSCFEQPDIKKWGTFYGGTNTGDDLMLDVVYAVKWRQSENLLYFVGRTTSLNLTLKNEGLAGGYYNNTYFSNSVSDWRSRGFIGKLKAEDGKLRWASLFGDSGRKTDGVCALHIGANGNIVVGGFAYDDGDNVNTAFPFTNAGSQHTQSEGGAYIAEFGPNNNLLWATKLANEPTTNFFNMTTVNDISEDANGSLLVAGTATRDVIGTPGDYIPFGGGPLTSVGGAEAFVMRFSSGRALQWSRFFGGSSDDYPNSIVGLENGDFYLTGTTRSWESDGFPVQAVGNASDITKNDVTYNGGYADMFVAKFLNNGTLNWCRYYGGAGNDGQGRLNYNEGDALTENLGTGNCAVADATGTLFLTGSIENGFSPIVGPNDCPYFYNTINQGINTNGKDAWVGVMSPSLKTSFSTYWGGSNIGENFDESNTIAWGHNQYNNKDFILFGGWTTSLDIPAQSKPIPHCHESDGPYYFSNLIGGSSDAFISKIYLFDCLTVGTKETPVEHLSLSPNPVESTLKIGFADLTTNIQVFNAAGQNLSEKTRLRSLADTEAILDVSQLPAGWYLISAVLQDGTVVSGKFIKL